MDKILYSVLDIRGDYAILLDDNKIENTVALALLPLNLDIGDVVKFEDLTYEIINV